MQIQYLETERLRLKRVTPEIYDHVFKTFPQEKIMRFFGHRSLEEFKAEKLRHEKGYESYGKSVVSFFPELKETEKVIGWWGFHTWYTLHARAEIGYFLYDDADKNKGYMKEAMVAGLKYGFEVMKLHRIEAMVAPGNEPSLKLMKKFGFRQEGHLKEHYFKNDHHEDSLVFGLLHTEWK